MSIQKEDFLTLANTLCNGADESQWRSAMSRAYYAAYHGCNDWHTQLPFPGSNTGPQGGMHQALINRLSNPDASVPEAKRKASKVLSIKLAVLRGKRTLADYDLGAQVQNMEASHACVLATEILGKL